MPTFGHKYLDISFMMAQSALRCSLLLTVFSASRSGSLFVAETGVAGFGLSTVSALTPSTAPFFGSAWPAFVLSLSEREEVANMRLRGDDG
ncbi:hypothetical protein IWX91DRAFT_124933 [Phyllosticta citricarpa]